VDDVKEIHGKIDSQNLKVITLLPIGKKVTVTKSDGLRVYQIDHKPSIEIFRKYLGDDIANTLPLSTAEFPFIITRGKHQEIVHTMKVHGDGSIELIDVIHVGEQLQFGYCHAGLLALGAQQIYQDFRIKQSQTVETM